MVGYPESLTDPSFAGQILCLSAVEVGNYGVPDARAEDALGLARFFESARIQVAGLIVADYSPEHSHWNAAASLGAWLRAAGVPALTGVDTRRIVKKIRDGGAMLAKIEFPGAPVPFFNPNAVNLVDRVSAKAVRVFNAGCRPHVVAIDCGIKNNIIRVLARSGIALTVVPHDYDLTRGDLGEIDGLFVSNGCVCGRAGGRCRRRRRRRRRRRALPPAQRARPPARPLRSAPPTPPAAPATPPWPRRPSTRCATSSRRPSRRARAAPAWRAAPPWPPAASASSPSLASAWATSSWPLPPAPRRTR